MAVCVLNLIANPLSSILKSEKTRKNRYGAIYSLERNRN